MIGEKQASKKTKIELNTRAVIKGKPTYSQPMFPTERKINFWWIRSFCCRSILCIMFIQKKNNWCQVYVQGRAMTMVTGQTVTSNCPLQMMWKPRLGRETGGAWGFLAGKCCPDSPVGGTECKPGWNRTCTQERKDFDLLRHYKSTHAHLRIAGVFIAHCKSVTFSRSLPILLQ